MDILDAENNIKDPLISKSKNFNRQLSFKNVSFQYDKNCFKKYQFNIKIGETVALVGESGSGKSTIAVY